MSKRAICKISKELLLEVLNMPVGTDIVAVLPDQQLQTDLVVLLENDEFADIPTGKPWPVVNPRFREVVNRAVAFEDWGLQ